MPNATEVRSQKVWKADTSAHYCKILCGNPAWMRSLWRHLSSTSTDAKGSWRTAPFRAFASDVYTALIRSGTWSDFLATSAFDSDEGRAVRLELSPPPAAAASRASVTRRPRPRTRSPCPRKAQRNDLRWRRLFQIARRDDDWWAVVSVDAERILRPSACSWRIIRHGPAAAAAEILLRNNGSANAIVADVCGKCVCDRASARARGGVNKHSCLDYSGSFVTNHFYHSSVPSIDVLPSTLTLRVSISVCIDLCIYDDDGDNECSQTNRVMNKLIKMSHWEFQWTFVNDYLWVPAHCTTRRSFVTNGHRGENCKFAQYILKCGLHPGRNFRRIQVILFCNIGCVSALEASAYFSFMHEP